MNSWSRREFLVKSGVASAGLGVLGSKCVAGDSKPADQELDFQRLLQPVPTHARFILKDWYVWGGSMTRTSDGVCHLLYARWPRAKRHWGWLTHSEIGYATAKHPTGPYTHKAVALPGKHTDKWVTDMTHNPTILHAHGKYYLYFTGARIVGQLPDGPVKTNSSYWQPTRMTQRIGVAVADHPAGPWRRIDKPLIDVTPGMHDHYFTTNPTVTQCPDGSFLMVYKCMGTDRKVFHGVAVAKHPLGPFKKDPKPIFTHAQSDFPAEDPFIWYQDDRFYGILKDLKGSYAGVKRSLALFHSLDGHRWELAKHPLVATRQVCWADKSIQEFMHLERPQLWLENGKPAVLFCAADLTREHSFNIHIPLKRM